MEHTKPGPTPGFYRGLAYGFAFVSPFWIGAGYVAGRIAGWF